nr:MAG TPA: hypothetical protein [Caudoviricetes sp.]
MFYIFHFLPPGKEVLPQISFSFILFLLMPSTLSNLWLWIKNINKDKMYLLLFHSH